MRQVQCNQCDAPIDLSVDLPADKRVCAYCGAPISIDQIQGATRGGRGPLVIILAVLGVVVLGLGGVAILLVARGADEAPPASVAIAPAPAPEPPKAAAPLFTPDPPKAVEPPAPPREPTTNDRLRAHFKKAGGKLCVAGNLSRFGPFMGKVRLVAHADGKVTGLRGEMQPRSPATLQCMREKLGTGLAFSGEARTLIYHFSGGRNPDGVQYRDGIEFQGSYDDASGAEAGAGDPAERGPQEKEATVLKVETLRGTRTTFTSGGVRRERLPPTYKVIVGLEDGTRFSFLHLKNKLLKGSRVLVRYVAEEGGRKTTPELPVADFDGRLIANVLPMLKPTPIGDETFGITFPAPPREEKTDLGTLYVYEYTFNKSYSPDGYYFFRTAAEGNGSLAFFKEQVTSLMALVNATQISASLKGGRDRKTGLRKASGRFMLRMGHTPMDGLIHLWHDPAKKLLYAAWVTAYCANQLASDKEMKRDFFGSFRLKR